jgi:hypothetical protein
MNDYKIWNRLSLLYMLKELIDEDNNVLLTPAPAR